VTTTFRITAGIFLALGGILYHFNQGLLSLIFTIFAILLLLASLFTHRKETKKKKEIIPDVDPNSLVVSKLQHPDLREHDHSACVVGCTIVNKSGQMATINKVNAYDHKDNPIQITWSNQISELGNPINPCELIGIKDTETLFLRENMGKEIEYCKLEIFHSFSAKPITVIFDEYADWDS